MRRTGAMRGGYVRRRRSRLEIAVEVLRACLEPNVPTRMMYATNTSWTAFRGILESLCEKGLIEFHETKTRTHGETRTHGDRDERILGLYEITEKGRSVLQQLEALEMDLVE